MDKSLLKPKRKSHIDKGEIYFWTATINKWLRLLEKDEYKDIIIDSLQYPPPGFVSVMDAQMRVFTHLNYQNKVCNVLKKVMREDMHHGILSNSSNKDLM